MGNSSPPSGDWTPDRILAHPGLLKLDLYRQGLRLDPALRQKLAIAPEASPYEIFATGIDLALPGGLWANVPFRGEEFSRSAYTLTASEGRSLLTHEPTGKAAAVTVLEKPRFDARRTESGRSYASIANLHGRFIYIFPLQECAYVSGGQSCDYCHLQPGADGSRAKPIEDVIEVLRAAFAYARPEVVYLSVGQIGEEDGGLALLEGYVRTIKKHFDTLVAVEVMPPTQMRWVVKAYAMGADAICFSLCAYDPAVFARNLPGRAADDGYPRYLAALKYSASVFPRGAVYTRLMVGIEPPESTLAGIERLSDLGVVPLLPIYRPAHRPGAPAHPVVPLDFQSMLKIYQRWHQIIQAKSLDTHWIRPVSLATMPIDGLTLGNDPGFANAACCAPVEPGAWERRYHRMRAAMRRRLRVRSLSTLSEH